MINRKNYAGNYREFENILFAAIVSAKAEGRVKILPKDISFEDIINDKKLGQVNNIRLMDIVGYADKEASKLCASIIREKIDEI